jgi:hypothetical protein
MNASLRTAVVAFALCSYSVPSWAQDAALSPRVALTDQQMEAFLLNAKVLSTRGAGNGVTNSSRVVMTDGTLTHDAHVQTVDIQKGLFNPQGAAPELNFKDSYRYNIAGYRLARLVGLTNVPVSVERRIQGRLAAVTWWIDDVLTDEGGRQKMADKDQDGPHPMRTSLQLHVMRLFDELIQNKDRNKGNMVWTKDWRMWLIDHTRAFRTGKSLLKPDLVQRCERAMCEGLRALTLATVTDAVGTSLTGDEVKAILQRRDAILTLVDARIARRGEAAVLFTLP